MSDPLLSALASRVRVPSANDRVHNEECCFSFDNPVGNHNKMTAQSLNESESGLYVCLESFLAFGRSYLSLYTSRSGRQLFLHRLRRRIQRAAGQDDVCVPEKVSKLAIGVPGGFKPEEDNFDIEETNSIVLLPSFQTFPLDDPRVPLAIQMSARGVLAAQSAAKKQEIAAASATWEGEALQVSKHAMDLLQLDNGVKVPPKGWKCEKCDLSTNLWLNLTDGSILCGRRYFDGSGGNNHALEHFKEVGYPLAVKLGTITPTDADVYDYVEDNMVLDPKLSDHLAHFGINIQQMSKTDASMTEMEIDINQKVGDWITLTEANANLKPLFGPGLTGMENMGNTCYLNSVMQVIFTIPSFIEAYVTKANNFFEGYSFDGNSDPDDDVLLQLAKLGVGLCSGTYSVRDEVSFTKSSKKLKDKSVNDMSNDAVKMNGKEVNNSESNEEAGCGKKGTYQRGIRACSFKNIIGRNHTEFSSKNQQDAQDFYLHFCNILTKEYQKRKAVQDNPQICMQFAVEDRIQCGTTGQVSYKSRIEDYLPLPIPMEASANSADVKAYEAKKEMGQHIPEGERVRHKIPFEAALTKMFQDEMITDFMSPASKTRTTASKRLRFKTFPEYLLFHLEKFSVDTNWRPVKLDVSMTMPDCIDLNHLKAKGPLDNEIIMKDEAEQESNGPTNNSATVVPDPSIVSQLLQMGFGENGCKKAVIHTKNSGVEAAMNWVIEHMEDPDFNDPIKDDNNKSSFEVDSVALESLLSLGVVENTKKAIKALKETSNNVERAVDWIFSHPDDDGTDIEDASASSSSSAAVTESMLSDGPGNYDLVAFISHMGQSVHVGHYVCHIRKNGEWVIFNDNKVARSEQPPKDLGYLYLYKRRDQQQP